MTTTTSRTNRTRSPRLSAIDERTWRVLELRDLVRQGRYAVDAAEVAAAMLGEWFGRPPEIEPLPMTPLLARFVVPRNECLSRPVERESALTA